MGGDPTVPRAPEKGPSASRGLALRQVAKDGLSARHTGTGEPGEHAMAVSEALGATALVMHWSALTRRT